MHFSSEADTNSSGYSIKVGKIDNVSMKKLNSLGCTSVRELMFWPSQYFFGGDLILLCVLWNIFYIFCIARELWWKTYTSFIQHIKNFADKKAMTANFLVTYNLFPQLIVAIYLTVATSTLNLVEIIIV